MPTINQAIVVNTSVVAPSKTYSGWGTGAIVGLSSYSTKNTPVRYTSLTQLQEDHGIASAVGIAGASIFAQGVAEVYAVSVQAATGQPTDAELETALNSLLATAYAGNIKAVCLAGIFSNSASQMSELKLWADEADKIFVVTNPVGATVAEITSAAAPLASSRGFFAAHNTPQGSSFEGDVAAAALGALMICRPGDTLAWAKVILPGVGQFTDAEIAQLELGRCNAVDDLQNTSVMRFTDGLSLTTTATDPAQYIDITITRMYITDTLRNALAQFRISTRKIPYTAAGIEYVRSTLIAAMDGMVSDDIITPDYTITMPNIDDISPSQIVSRVLTGIAVQCTSAGNMQRFTINLTMEAA